MGSRGEKSFLQSIAATVDGTPLLYPEGALQPGLYWLAEDDGSIVGALPVPFMNAKQFTKRYGIAGLVEHVRTRGMNFSLLSATDPKSVFLNCDILNNLYLRGCDSRIILNRGLEFLAYGTQNGANVSSEDETLVGCDVIDNRNTVQQLATMFRSKAAHFFFTFSCNMRKTFGVKEVYAWMEAKIESIRNSKTMRHKEKEEMIWSVSVVSQIQMFRTWTMVTEVIMNWIINSDEKPLLGIERFFWRYDTNKEWDNLPHIHALFTVFDGDDPSQQDALNEKVRCSIKTFMTEEEEDIFIARGLLRDKRDARDMRDEAHTLEQHDCKGARDLCKTITDSNGNKQCRVPDHFEINPHPTQYCYADISSNYSEEAETILRKCGLIKKKKNGSIELHPGLRGGKFCYPADRGEKFTPCNNEVFAVTRGQNNLQRVSDTFHSNYVASYAAMEDAKTRATFKADTVGRVKIETQNLGNQKIGSNRAHQTKEDNKKSKEQNKEGDGDIPSGIMFRTTEALFSLFQIPRVHMSEHFVKYPNVPFEERPGFIVRKRKVETNVQNTCEGRPPDDYGGGVLDSVAVRTKLDLPEWRQLTKYQKMTLNDRFGTSISLDLITIFSVRPPELLAVMDPSLYVTSFVRSGYVSPRKVEGIDGVKSKRCTSERLLSRVVADSCWVDGTDCQVRIRRNAVISVLKYLESRKETRCSSNLIRTLTNVRLIMSSELDEDELLDPSWTPASRFRYEEAGDVIFDDSSSSDSDDNQSIGSEFDEDLGFDDIPSEERYGVVDRLVYNGPDKDVIPLVQYVPVKPTSPHRFLVSVVLSMGEFETEAEIWVAKNMRGVFENCGLVSLDSKNMVACVNRIVRRYILEQLFFIPKSTRTFCYYLNAAYNVLLSALLFDELHHDEMPPCLVSALKDKVTKQYEAFKDGLRCGLVEVFSRRVKGAVNLPSVDELLNAENWRPLDWHPEVRRCWGQSNENFVCQKKLLAVTMKALDCLSLVSGPFPHFIFGSGEPGSGKTMIMMIGALYAVSRGLTVIATCIEAERALGLGGQHIHKLLPIPVNDSASITRLSSMVLMNLERHPEKKTLIRELDVLFLDEIGKLGAGMFSVLDIVFRDVRNSRLPMGGVYCMGTIDFRQIQPIRGLPFLTSQHVLTTFKFYNMKGNVRYRFDK
eukprot:scaffold244588_cov43-Attheya_sp.AAC.4